MQQIARPDGVPGLAWNTEDVRPAEQFAYYREAICQVFMKLTPEPTDKSSFPARIERIGLGAGAINRVRFPGHLVLRSASDIAASSSSCFYLNLKLAGHCRIEQDGRNVELSAGQVGIFDSARLFALHHSRGPSLHVASFWVPAQLLLDRLPPSFAVKPARVSDDPLVGHLIVETARALNSAAPNTPEEENARLFGVLLDLVALSLSRDGRRDMGSISLVEATWIALRRAVERRLREPGLTAAAVAASVSISERYVHKLFARAGTSFAGYVMDRRLDGAARDLRDPLLLGRAIGDIAFDWGFSDLSHFTRRFRHRFGCTPRDWRRG
ncbi:helix-turn-helix domain-containing protein [Bradyrhizobium genosp. L]|uniref:helix-turn-helix domain-containing protein n=1 Tax=Bradyrhizobium genosp. L TaxID=83637 RepID=UPI0018A2D8AF|nr:helix-turn-helix domain-containing protein [Bradyrhizobium genosp. L]QPF83603.1 helix-turn-helix domain-containing protein [Bradyrhizobium genosp. L]